MCSIVATAWLATRVTARAIEQEQGQAISEDSRTYEALLTWAVDHTDWSGAQPLVERLARETGHRVALATQNRAVLADSARPGASPLPARASATVDALAVETGISGKAGDSRIDPRVVGPFRLTAGERQRLRTLAERRAECLRGAVGGEVTITTTPSGRPRVTAADYDGPRCRGDGLDEPTRTEAVALGRLDTLVDDCLRRRGAGAVRLNPDLSWVGAGAGAPDPALVSTCLDSGRRQQLDSYVPPAALLFIGSPRGAAGSAFDLSPQNRLRVVGVVAAVLLLSVAVTVSLGLRLVRPLRALTVAAHRMRDVGEAVPVPVTGRDEVGRLTEVFNEMSRRRAELERMRREMVGDVAHELRTPLSNIRGWLEAAEDGLVPADGALVGSLLEEALLLQHIIDDLRDLAAADAGELRLYRVRCDAAELLRQVATAHLAQAEQAGVSLVVASDSVPGELLGDPLRVRQALGNLVTNAVRHTPSGGTVTLRAERDTEDVVFSVADTGAGIGPADLPHVFDRFWRAEKSRSRGSGGSGLGLSIVRNLAQAHGGSATVRSTHGVGSVFFLRLPAGGEGGAEPGQAPPG
ncbi:sensor histidine kinase [Streptomyces sp. NPDC091281]|uniref:sensor histidine kinase n=1 Tax=Streptomyces sp. NPDC091281 TaxID=3365985 RepID=UPI00382A6AFC